MALEEWKLRLTSAKVELKLRLSLAKIVYALCENDAMANDKDYMVVICSSFKESASKDTSVI